MTEVVEALTSAADEGLHPVLYLRDGQRGEALSRQHKLVADGAADACVERLDALLNAVLGGGNKFGGSRGSSGAQIGDEVCNGEVGLVADRGDDRQRGGRNGAGERLVVESGEVFQRASAARDQDEISLSWRWGWCEEFCAVSSWAGFDWAGFG